MTKYLLKPKKQSHNRLDTRCKRLKLFTLETPEQIVRFEIKTAEIKKNCDSFKPNII